ncbi:hypothetical protein CHX26_06980 [Porphyrobacter sp. HT-58-2]|uniref:DUF1905 domain-containing protein n=1 Tax=Porphyrobacter sp. HT-58-2 TaxID=2023229 RepID=UPI000CDCA77A|nr:DUF1905 domain-containing protein [Porphyrobacter sp. HT-58-2]AUX69273.1 hypothetical protein CHX26_06980 [Porphyrobacter sp. HT-58-2]
MDADLARFLRDELGHAPEAGAGPWPESWNVRGPVWLWQGSDGAPTKGAWYFLTIDGETAQAIRAGAVNAAAWGSVYVEATVGGTTWRTSLFPSKAHGGWLLPLKAAVRKAEKIVDGTEVEAVLVLA